MMHLSCGNIRFYGLSTCCHNVFVTITFHRHQMISLPLCRYGCVSEDTRRQSADTAYISTLSSSSHNKIEKRDNLPSRFCPPPSLPSSSPSSHHCSSQPPHPHPPPPSDYLNSLLLIRRAAFSLPSSPPLSLSFFPFIPIFLYPFQNYPLSCFYFHSSQFSHSSLMSSTFFHFCLAQTFLISISS